MDILLSARRGLPKQGISRLSSSIKAASVDMDGVIDSPPPPTKISLTAALPGDLPQHCLVAANHHFVWTKLAVWTSPKRWRVGWGGGGGGDWPAEVAG